MMVALVVFLGIILAAPAGDSAAAFDAGAFDAGAFDAGAFDAGAFDAGNKLYRAGRYREALGKYAEAAAGGSGGGVLAYNMGNCLFRLGRASEALHAYLVAEIDRPRDPQVAANIAAAASRLGTDPDPGGGFGSRLRSWVGRVSPVERLAVRLALILLAGGAALIAGVRIAAGRGMPGARWLVFAALLLVAGVLNELGPRSGPRGSTAVVVQDAALVFNEPSERAAPLFSLRDGEVVRTRGAAAAGGWLRIADREGHEGWARGVAVLPVSAPALFRRYR